MKNRVFISYSYQDKATATILANLLMTNGINVLLDDLGSLTNEDLAKKTQEAITQSSAIVLLVSRNYEKSNWAAFERGIAYAFGKKIIPILIDDSSKVPSDLSNVKHLVLDQININQLLSILKNQDDN